MKASASDQRSILDIQKFDFQSATLRNKAANLPELAEINSLTIKQNNARDLRIAAETELSDVKRELARAEGDVEQIADEHRQQDLDERGRPEALADGIAGQFGWRHRLVGSILAAPAVVVVKQEIADEDDEAAPAQSRDEVGHPPAMLFDEKIGQHRRDDRRDAAAHHRERDSQPASGGEMG